MFDVFELKTGKFTALTEAQQATLTEPQLDAYDDFAAAVDNLSAADTEWEAAIAANRAAGEALQVALATQAKSPKWTRIDEARASIATTRPDYLAKTGPLTVVDPSIGAAVIEAQRLHADCQMRLTAAVDMRRVCNGRLALNLQRWQNATMQTISQEQLVRAHLASELQLRKDRAVGRVPERAPPRIANSAIDQFSFYTKAQGRGTGGGRSFGRPSARGVQGSYPPSMRGHTIPKE